MMMRSSRTEPPDLTSCVAKTTDDMIESLVCPPPPSDSALNEEAISSLIVPAPKWNKAELQRRFSEELGESHFTLDP